MAILDHIEITIRVDGQNLPEHPINTEAEENGFSSHLNHCVESDTVTTKYIEVIPGKNFVISYSLLPEFYFGQADHIAFETYLDGCLVTGAIIRKSDWLWRTECEGTIHGEPSNFHVRKFVFSSAQTDETVTFRNKEELGNAMREHAQSGTMEVRVWPQKRKKRRNVTTLAPIALVETSIPTNVASTRAIDSRVTLGPDENITEQCVVEGDTIGVNPIATFIFEYRGQEALYQLGILERPKPMEERDMNTLNVAELRQLLHQQRIENETLRKRIKYEKQEFQLGNSPAIKRARPASPFDDDEVQVIKKPRKETELTVIELND